MGRSGDTLNEDNGESKCLRGKHTLYMYPLKNSEVVSLVNHCCLIENYGVESASADCENMMMVLNARQTFI